MLERDDSFAHKAANYAWLIASICLSSVARAEQLQIAVFDRNGDPVEDVVVYIEHAGSVDRSTPEAYAVMDQIDSRFEPHILVIQTGTEVRFPNSDVVAHHVYSFSNPNDFMLPLYKGDAHAPVTFHESGVVTLGCNIHDQMLGYILIVNGENFAKTDQNGVALLTVSASSTDVVKIWSPRITSKDEMLSQAIPVILPARIDFKLRAKISAPHSSETGALKWSDY